MFGQSDDAAQMNGRLEVGWRARQLGRDPIRTSILEVVAEGTGPRLSAECQPPTHS